MEYFQQAVARFQEHEGGVWKWPRNGFSYSFKNQTPMPIEPHVLQAQLPTLNMTTAEDKTFVRGLIRGLNQISDDADGADVEMLMDDYHHAYMDWYHATRQTHEELAINEAEVDADAMQVEGGFKDHCEK